MNTTPTANVFDRLSALADSTRSRLLLILDAHELTVSELCAVVQLPQSTVSRHLKILADDGWVTSRAEGTSRLYRLDARLEPDALRLWNLVREQVDDSAMAAQDAQRVRGVLEQRRAKSQEFFSSAAGQWDGLRAELFGQRPDLFALLALMDESWTVGDLGAGTGQLAVTLAPFVRHVIAVDASPAMLSAARERLAGSGNVEIRAGELESLPIEGRELDVAIFFLVLHYVPEPVRALAEARRALKPGGRLLVVDMMPHDREEYRQRMGHVWQGFSESQLDAWLTQAGFGPARYHPLPVDASAKGPLLFAAAARSGG